MELLIVPPRAARAFAIGLALFCGQATAAPLVFFGEDLGAGSAAAIPNSFAARDAFVSGLSSFGVETFEGFAGGSVFPSAGSLTFAGTAVTASLTGGLVRDTPFNERFAISGTNYLDTSSNQRITFSSPISAFGLFVIDANEVNNNPAAVTVGGAPLTPAQIDARPFDSVDGIFRIVTERSPGTFEVLFDGGAFPALSSSGMFVGLIDSINPFNNIVLINGTSGLDTQFQDGFGYDNIIVGTATVGKVPEPATAALFAIGLLGIAAIRGRHRSR